MPKPYGNYYPGGHWRSGSEYNESPGETAWLASKSSAHSTALEARVEELEGLAQQDYEQRCRDGKTAHMEQVATSRLATENTALHVRLALAEAVCKLDQLILRHKQRYQPPAEVWNDQLRELEWQRDEALSAWQGGGAMSRISRLREAAEGEHGWEFHDLLAQELRADCEKLERLWQAIGKIRHEFNGWCPICNGKEWKHNDNCPHEALRADFGEERRE